MPPDDVISVEHLALHDGEPSGGYNSQHHVEVTPPALLRRGEEVVVRSLRRAVKDLVFLNSRGEVTAYAHSGTRRWLQRTDASWQKGGGDHASLTTFPLRKGGAVEAGPSMRCPRPLRHPETSIPRFLSRVASYVLASIHARPTAIARHVIDTHLIP